MKIDRPTTFQSTLHVSKVKIAHNSCELLLDFPIYTSHKEECNYTLILPNWRAKPSFQLIPPYSVNKSVLSPKVDVLCVSDEI